MGRLKAERKAKDDGFNYNFNSFMGRLKDIEDAHERELSSNFNSFMGRLKDKCNKKYLT